MTALNWICGKLEGVWEALLDYWPTLCLGVLLDFLLWAWALQQRGGHLPILERAAGAAIEAVLLQLLCAWPGRWLDNERLSLCGIYFCWLFFCVVSLWRAVPL